MVDDGRRGHLSFLSLTLTASACLESNTIVCGNGSHVVGIRSNYFCYGQSHCNLISSSSSRRSKRGVSSSHVKDGVIAGDIISRQFNRDMSDSGTSGSNFKCSAAGRSHLAWLVVSSTWRSHVFLIHFNSILVTRVICSLTVLLHAWVIFFTLVQCSCMFFIHVFLWLWQRLKNRCLHNWTLICLLRLIFYFSLINLVFSFRKALGLSRHPILIFHSGKCHGGPTTTCCRFWASFSDRRADRIYRVRPCRCRRCSSAPGRLFTCSPRRRGSRMWW
mmetsp:Transcript_39534/g.69502  ORF Transcript_39534/g.69502 Transcript_39534/m.69502 type:complete len:275 (-) Transcript_39534:1553-2377(-)